jgi:hypothetical protein
MPDISQITRPKLVETTVDFGDGETVRVEFDRNAITPGWVADAERRDTDTDRMGLASALAAVITGWDVTSGEEAFPPFAENIARLSFPLQAMLLRGVLTAAVPSSAEGNFSSGRSNTPSSGSSSPPATSPNGPAALSSPALSTSPSPT